MPKATSGPNNHQPIPRTNIRIQDGLINYQSPINPKPYNIKYPTHLISRQTRTKHRPHNLRINIIRQNRQVIRIERDILLKRPILVVKMVRTRNAVLLRTRKTELAPSTDAAREPDPYQPADFQARGVRDIRAKRDHPADTFVAAHVWQFDLCYRVAV